MLEQVGQENRVELLALLLWAKRLSQSSARLFHNTKIRRYKNLLKYRLLYLVDFLSFIECPVGRWDRAASFCRLWLDLHLRGAYQRTFDPRTGFEFWLVISD